MASIFDYQFNVGGNFTAAMEGMLDSTGRFRAKIEDCNNWIGKISNTFASLDMASNYVEKINGVFSGITEAGANAELQLMNLKTLFGGNAEAAEAMYERISEYGKVTPYDKAGLLEAQRTMMSFGMSGEAAFSTLQQIGDIAMGDSQKLQSLALAFAQMSSTGKLTGQDLMQMINAGFNPLNEISKQTGKSVSDLKEDMSNGAISVDMVSEAFSSATSEGGLFYGAIEAASETTAGRMASIQDSIEEIKVKIFNTLGDFGLWINTISQVMIPISQTLPLIMGVGKAMLWVKSLQWGSMWGSIRGFLYASRIQMLMMNQELKTGQIASNGFFVNITRATLGVVRFATVGIFQALKGLGALLLSFITTGTASATFSTIATGAFGAFKVAATTACRAVGVAIMNIPIIGWIAAAVAALIALGAYFWNTSVKFRAILKGLGAAFIQTFKGIWDCAVDVFSAIGKLLKDIFTLNWGSVDDDIRMMGNAFADYGAKIGEAFANAYNAEMAKEKNVEDEVEKEQEIPEVPGINTPTSDTTNPTGSTLSNVSGTAAGGSSGSVRNITITIDKLVEKFEIRTTNMQGDMSRVKDMVSEALLSALNDVNLAM